MNTFKKTGWIRSTTTGSKDEIHGIIYKATKIEDNKEAIRKNYGKDIEHVYDLVNLKDIKE